MCCLRSAGNLANGAHRCIICNKAVHIINENYSIAVDGTEEGYGQKRICIECLKKGNKELQEKEYFNSKTVKQVQINNKQKICWCCRFFDMEEKFSNYNDQKWK